MTDEELPVQRSGAETTADGRRVLGMVPGKPVAGDRKEPDEQDLVMVWHHLLVRHAVAGTVHESLVLGGLSRGARVSATLVEELDEDLGGAIRGQAYDQWHQLVGCKSFQSDVEGRLQPLNDKVE